jgi:hypothetical protein
MSARSLAQALGMKDAAQLLQENLKEEEQQDRALSKISKRLIKEASAAEKEMNTEEVEQRGRASRGKPSVGRASRTSNGRRSNDRRSSGGSAAKSSGGQKLSRMTTDHEEIRRWAEERGAHPAKVKGTEIIRLDFPGYTGEGKLEPIGWEEFFKNFDDRGLALVYQEKTSRGQKSNFNKLVDRRSAA